MMNAAYGTRRWPVSARLRGATLVALSLSLVGVPLAVASPPVQDASASNSTFVYSVDAQGNGVGLVYDRYAFLALSPILNVGFPRASVGVDDTPSATSFASPADPGLLGALAAVGPVLGVPPGVIPQYPLYANAGYPNGQRSGTVGVQYAPPGSSQDAAAAVSGKAMADLDRASAAASFGTAAVSGPIVKKAHPVRVPALGAARSALPLLLREARLLFRSAGLNPAAESTSDLVSVAGGEAISSVRRSGTGLSAFSEGRALGVSLLGGLIKIDSVRGTVRMTWASPTARPVVTSSSEVVGASVMGFPVTVDGAGLHFLGTTVPLPVEEAVNRLINDRGGRFTVGEKATTANRASVAALSFRFHGVIQPELPPLLHAERDDLDLLMGTGVLGYSSTFVKIPVLDFWGQLGGGQDGLTGPGDIGGVSPPLAVAPSLASGSSGASTGGLPEGGAPGPEVAKDAKGTNSPDGGVRSSSTGLALLSSDSLNKWGWLIPFEGLVCFLLFLLGWARARGLLGVGGGA